MMLLVVLTLNKYNIKRGKSIKNKHAHLAAIPIRTAVLVNNEYDYYYQSRVFQSDKSMIINNYIYLFMNYALFHLVFLVTLVSR